MNQVGLPVRHPALEPGLGVVPGEVRLADRVVVGIVLQAAGLLSHLAAVGWRLRRDWDGAVVDPSGLLRSVCIEPGPGRPTHGVLAALLLRGLGGVEGVEGRGAARRSARLLLELWRDPLLPIEPDHVVGEILAAAPFLWDPAAGAARATLVAHTADGAELLAGPAACWRRVAAGSGGAPAVAAITSPKARAWWTGECAQDPLGSAREAFRSGRFERARELAEEARGPWALALVARCRAALGDQRGARETLKGFDDVDLEPSLLLEVADIALRVYANLGEPERVRVWSRRVLAEAPSSLKAQAELLAGLAAWDRGDQAAMRAHLDRASPLARTEKAWMWHQARALEALAGGNGPQMVVEVTAALQSRRRLGVVEAAALWNDLAVGRVLCDDLVGAEKAQRQAIRLQRRLDGPRRHTLGLRNLAEIRLRRGRLDGVAEILEASIARNRVDDQIRGLTQDWVLWARYELLQGRPLAAVETLASARRAIEAKGIEWHRGELEVVWARALGWLGRAAEARDMLDGVAEEECAILGREERPALFAHAGDHAAALREASTVPERRFWQALLTGEPPPKTWDVIDRLEPLRRARLYYDWEILSPGWVPAPRLRWAVWVLERGGAAPLAAFLERRVGGPWEALAHFSTRDRADDAAVTELFAGAGWSHVHLVVEGASGNRVLVDGPGGSAVAVEELSTGERLRLAAPQLDARLRSLLAAVKHRWPAPPRLSPQPVRVPDRSSNIIGRSPALLQELERLRRLARGQLPILILGESGTGKELAARAVHLASARSDGPFLPVNSAALSENLLLSELFGHVRGAFTGADRDRAGVFEAARGGTVFLDEVGDLPPVAQGMLLRVLQEHEIRRVGESLPRKVDVRVVAATHRNLVSMVAEGGFRQDLFYRLRVGVISLPPLRDRGEDLVAIAEHVLARCRPGARFSAAAVSSLRAHRWPGNIRELANVVETAAAIAESEVIEPVDLQLPQGITDGRDAPGYHEQVLAYRRKLVQEAFDRSGGRQAEAARSLGLTRQSLSYLVRQLKIG